ncbi:MAG TPA: flagellar motor switch protein FliN [Chromatiaceae bacterium]|jgi:flagellar motor switch protein FliN/FliY|nr:flagellar motor switch protein FliN [Chromatiaceae bacterium]HIB85107.1 flagellar motor switch protein FliN [Chromatiaceae bacterium]HIN82678.1 flagellar motor switch protein FliN [Chromatiales bacterium]HIO14955.1 flagellar motor switch protein FliN [Chromatiales bacterium]HIO53738.1 flagellar motor switch protein FliN [Chromatiales bacterium]
MSEESEDEGVMDEWASALEESGDSEAAETAISESVVAAEKAEFENLEPTALIPEGDVKMDVILDVPVTISMEIGRTHISIRNLLQLNQGSVVELDRLAGEPMDVLVNGTLIAQGEVVVVNEKFGLRLTDVISPSERIKKLK